MPGGDGGAGGDRAFLDGGRKMAYTKSGGEDMNAKKVIGIVLILLAVALIGLVIFSVWANMAHEGPVAGKIVSYKPPFYGHGLWMVIFIGVGGLSFLGGLMLFVIGQRETK